MTEEQVFPVDPEPADALTETECRQLLQLRTFGRIGVTSGGLPAILPVRYSYEDDAIMFRLGTGSELRAARTGDVLAFQVDAYDPETCAGWSVLVLGRASVLTTEQYENDGLPALDHCVYLDCELVTGRVLNCGGEPGRKLLVRVPRV